MFKNLNNWHLSVLIAFVSIVSIALIQQYVTAQGTWTNPNSLPGATPNNTFIVNPLGEDLNLNLNKIVGDGTALPNVVIDPSGSTLNAINVNNNRKICLNGDCKSAWPSVTGGVLVGSNFTEYRIPRFELKDGKASVTDSYLYQDPTSGVIKYTYDNGGMQITNNAPGAPAALDIHIGQYGAGPPGSGERRGLYIHNSGYEWLVPIEVVNNGYDQERSSMIIRHKGITGVNAVYINNVSTSASNAFYIKNQGTGSSFFVDDSINGSVDNTPFVIDNRGFVGIATSTPTHTLEILGHGDSANSAEIALYTPSITHNAGHWGMYHYHNDQGGDGTIVYTPNSPDRDDLVFWHNGWNQARFTAEGKLYLRSPEICDINGANCVAITSESLGGGYWTQDASGNLSRTRSNVFLLATSTSSLPSGTTGAGTRMLWYPNKSAFRAGNVSGTQWDAANVGNYSVAFGMDSTASADYSVVAGGRINTAAGAESFVGGGRTNTIFINNGLEAFIGGGYNNKIGETSAAVQSAIVAGGSNSVLGNASFIGSGVSNAVNGASSVVVGGTNNIVNSDVSFIGGGTNNSVTGSWWSAILAGRYNAVSSKFSVVGGGLFNIASGDYSFVGGGSTSTASGIYSSILGGTLNTASGSYSTIGGGIGNQASSDYAVVAGGHYNAAGYKSFVGSGSTNVASGQFSVIPGGSNNIAAGDWSFAGGRNMQLSSAADRTFVWGYGDSAVSITRDNSFIIFPNDPSGSVPRVGIGTTSPNSTLHVKSNSGNSEIDIQSGSSPYWAIYQDDTTDELRLWNNGANKVVFSSKGLGVVSNSTDGVDNYIQLDHFNGMPPSTDCDEASEEGRMFWKGGDFDRLMICGGAVGWKTFISS